ncbi:hypothetical protein C8R46DRAFT_1044808 [Mycena filopes]|nr:hypothetical protein C8R46DRAFT_1044808 [Mycena filopes]
MTPTTYRALLALAESHTKKLESTVQAILAQKRERQKRQEESDQKQRDLETQLWLQYFQQQQQKKGTNAEAAESFKLAKEAELLRREAIRRDTLRYGPRRSTAGRQRSSGPPGPVDGASDKGPVNKATALTRKDKREHRLQAELHETFTSPPPRRRRRRSAGSDLQPATDTVDSSAGDGYSNAKARLAALPNTFTRLNVVKRDIRTVDEIVRDNHKRKGVLEGDLARNFDNWFGNSMPSIKTPDKEVIGGGRKRFLSVDANPRGKRRRIVCEGTHSDSLDNDCLHPASLGKEIWALFGRDKTADMALDVNSDSEESVTMDAGPSTLEREEKISERLAREEDRKAEVDERMRVEGKRTQKLGIVVASVV